MIYCYKKKFLHPFLNKKTIHKIFLFLLFTGVIFGLSKVANQKQDIVYDSPQINFDSQSGIGHLNLLRLKNPATLINTSINFEFINKDSNFLYGNIFQTSSEINGIRLEFQPKNKLFLIIGNNRLFLISDHIQENQPYKINIAYKEGGGLKVSLNKVNVLDLTSDQIKEDKFQIKNFSIGSGFGLSRNFNGIINQFSASIKYRQVTLLGKIFDWLLFITTFLGLTLATYLLFSPNRNNSQSVVKTLSIFDFRKYKLLPLNFNKPYYLYPVSLALLAISICLIQFANEKYFGILKWIPYLLIPLSILIAYFLKDISFVKSTNKFNALLISLLIIYPTYLIFTSFKQGAFNPYLFFFLLLCISFYPVFNMENWVVFSLVAIVSWLSIRSLENWIFLDELLRQQPFPYLLISGFALVCIFLSQSSTRQHANSQLASYLFKAIILCAFLYLSFRSDTLFIPGSEYHWEYFTGPVRTIRNGGWLLFNAPSQYGFLNILLANAVPYTSTWQSFYIFQGLILYAVSTTTLLVLLHLCGENWPRKIILTLLVVASFFFADPHWIGPLPFPSSSVTRFFCCYLLIFSTLVPLTNSRKRLFITSAWCVGFLWSAESAFYCTSIYLFIIVSDTLTSNPGSDKIGVLKYYLKISLLALLSIITLISIYYFLNIGNFPNFYSYFDYAIGYASGYGYVPFPVNGPGNLLFLIFLGVGVLLLASINTFQKDAALKYGAIAGCIWAVSSYYLGRPVPQNITALFPLLTFCALLTINLATQHGLKKFTTPIFAASLPLYFLILATYFSPSWWQQLQQIKSFSFNISQHLPKASDKIEEAINSIDPNNDIPVVFFSDGAAAPYSQKLKSLNNENSWLPTPLQLLMPPISEHKQEAALSKFVCLNFREKGILIYQSGSISYALPGILQNLDRLLSVKSVIDTGDQKIYLFEKGPSFMSTCNSLIK